MANVFIHFEPIGPVGEALTYGTTDLPPYLIPGSLEEGNWRKNNPNGHKIMKTQAFTDGTTDAHTAARDGNIDDLKDYIENNEASVNAKDANGWTPLHEGVRGGNVEVVKFLLEKGSNVNSRTGESEDGGSVLHLARQLHGDDHEIVELLHQYGAKLFAPGDSSEL